MTHVAGGPPAIRVAPAGRARGSVILASAPPWAVRARGTDPACPATRLETQELLPSRALLRSPLREAISSCVCWTGLMVRTSMALGERGHSLWAPERRTFGVLSAYFRRTIPARLAAAGIRLSVHWERDSRAESRESVRAGSWSSHPRQGRITAESRRELRAGHQHGEIGGKKAERRYAE